MPDDRAFPSRTGGSPSRTSGAAPRPAAGPDGFWEPVHSNVVDCFVQFFDFVLPRESLSVVRLLAYFLQERLAWCDAEGNPRAPREILELAELDESLALDRKSIRSALGRAVEAGYLEPVATSDGAGFRIKLDLAGFTSDPNLFQGFYPYPTHRIRVPLEFFTTVVRNETLSTIKVVACIIRMTLGSIDNLGRADITPAISQQQFVRQMNMGRRQAIEGVQSALLRGYIRRIEQGSLQAGRPSTYGLYWRRSEQALSWPEQGRAEVEVVPLAQVMGKGDQGDGKKGSGGWEKGIRGMGKRDQGDGKKGSGSRKKGIRESEKRDQEDGKKGSGAADPIDLIKDLDLKKDLSSAASAASDRAPAESRPRGARPAAGAAAAAASAFGQGEVFPERAPARSEELGSAGSSSAATEGSGPRTASPERTRGGTAFLGSALSAGYSLENQEERAASAAVPRGLSPARREPGATGAGRGRDEPEGRWGASQGAPGATTAQGRAEPGAPVTVRTRIRARFPLGNPHIVERFLLERGGAFVATVLDALERVDPAFLRRFTRSADPAWAVFHTCCQQGILPPVQKAAAPRTTASGEDGAGRGAHEASDEASRRWSRLEPEERCAELVELWRDVWRLYLGGLPDQAATDEVARALADEVAADPAREALEHWVFADIARRRGRSIGPIAAGAARDPDRVDG